MGAKVQNICETTKFNFVAKMVYFAIWILQFRCTSSENDIFLLFLFGF